MDDQAVGVQSETEGRRLIRSIQESLNRQRLTLNTAKTRILSQAEIVETFCLDENERIDALSTDAGSLTPEIRNARFLALAPLVASRRNTGQWTKVAERLYRLAATWESDCLSLEACKLDLVARPVMAKYIFRYLVARGRYDDHLALFDWLLESGESHYEDVEEEWFESLLAAAPPSVLHAPILEVAADFAAGTQRGAKRRGPRVPAVLLIYWLAPLNAPTRLQQILEGDPDLDGDRQRTLAAALCALQPAQASTWLTLAARESAPQVSSLIEWIARLQRGERVKVPSPLIRQRRPLNVGPFVYDARTWLRMELLALSNEKEVRKALRIAFDKATRGTRLSTETTAANRLRPRIYQAPLF